jgi:hypothetical protein
LPGFEEAEICDFIKLAKSMMSVLNVDVEWREENVVNVGV